MVYSWPLNAVIKDGFLNFLIIDKFVLLLIYELIFKASVQFLIKKIDILTLGSGSIFYYGVFSSSDLLFSYFVKAIVKLFSYGKKGC